MPDIFSAGRYACAHIEQQRLLFPAAEARLLLTDEDIVKKGEISCIPYDNRWVPVYGMNEKFHCGEPNAPFVLVLDDHVNMLAISCKQLTWTEISTEPQMFPDVLRWRGCPIGALSSETRDNFTIPLWLSSLSMVWRSLEIQSEQVYESERLAG